MRVPLQTVQVANAWTDPRAERGRNEDWEG
jgi:hypothetical protein